MSSITFELPGTQLLWSSTPRVSAFDSLPRNCRLQKQTTQSGWRLAGGKISFSRAIHCSLSLHLILIPSACSLSPTGWSMQLQLKMQSCSTTRSRSFDYCHTSWKRVQGAMACHYISAYSMTLWSGNAFWSSVKHPLHRSHWLGLESLWQYSCCFKVLVHSTLICQRYLCT